MAHSTERRTPLTFHLVFHTHWDREWYLPRAAFTARLVPVVDELVEALERDPAFRTFHLDGQTALLEDYLRIRPEMQARVSALVASGRIGAGPWYILPDELIPSGEALIRNLLLGTAASARLGRSAGVMYSPDAFGHPGALPTIAAQFGIEQGVLWRGLAPARDDGDVFRWAGAGGGELLCYQLPRDGYEIGAALPAEIDALREAWPGVRETLVSRAATRHVAVFVGADHHAAHPAPSVLRELIAELEPRHDVRISSPAEFLDAARRDRPRARALRGELRDSYGYTWTLQGVHGTRLPLKRLNARAELLLERWAEPLAALAGRHGGGDARPLLAEAWRAVVQSQFHDTIAGCTHDRVAAEAEGRLADAMDTAREVVRASLDELAGHDPDAPGSVGDSSSLILWNPSARRRGGVVVADVTFFRRDVLVGPPGARLARTGKGFEPFHLNGNDGSQLPVQVIEERRGLERRDASRHYPDLDEVDAVRIAFEYPALGGLATAHLASASGAGPRIHGDVVATGRRLSNGVIAVELSRDGNLWVQDLRSGTRFPRLFRIESEADAGDTYSFAPGAAGVRKARMRVSARLLASGPLTAILVAEWEAVEASFGLRIELRSGEPFVRLSLDIANRGTDRRLRARFPTGVVGVPVTAGAAFGVELRPAGGPKRDSPREDPAPTAPAHRYVAASNGSSGLALLVPGHCEYEWEAGGDLLLTLLRSVGQLSRADLPTRPGHAGWPTATPGAQCLGADRITFAVAPLATGDVAPERLHDLWERAFLPISGRWLRDANPLHVSGALIELAGDGLILSAVKPAEDGHGIVLRCWNATEQAVAGRWRVVPGPARAWIARADETQGEAIVADAGGTVAFTAPPRGIVTLRIE